MAGKSFFRFFSRLLKTNISQVYSLKLNFWIESMSMLASDLIMFATWIVLFHQFKEINGWGFRHVILMQAISMCAYSLYSFCFRGLADTLAGYIERGELDNFILQPRNILINVACSRSSPFALGDFMSGIIFFGWSGMVSFHNILVTILSVLLGFLIFVSVAIFIGSLAFYIRDVEGWGIQIMIIFLNMSTQPGSIYTGGVRIFLMFLFPAGMLTFLPVEMINNASWPSILIPIGIAVSFFLGSIWFFYHGLRRYESGNSFGVRD